MVDNHTNRTTSLSSTLSHVQWEGLLTPVLWLLVSKGLSVINTGSNVTFHRQSGHWAAKEDSYRSVGGADLGRVARRGPVRRPCPLSSIVAFAECRALGLHDGAAQGGFDGSRLCLRTLVFSDSPTREKERGSHGSFTTFALDTFWLCTVLVLDFFVRPLRLLVERSRSFPTSHAVPLLLSGQNQQQSSTRYIRGCLVNLDNETFCRVRIHFWTIRSNFTRLLSL